MSSAAPDMTLAVRLSAVVIKRRNPDEGRYLFPVHGSEFRQFGDHAADQF